MISVIESFQTEEPTGLIEKFMSWAQDPFLVSFVHVRITIDLIWQHTNENILARDRISVGCVLENLPLLVILNDI